MKIAMGIIIFLVLSFAAYITLPWLAISINLRQLPDPPQPEITYGEFPFTLVYEINGERITVEDTVICEYDGVGRNEGQGKYRKWKSYLASTGEKSVLLVVDGTRKIRCYVGDAGYYMGDERYPEKRPFTPRLNMSDPNMLVSEITNKKEIIASYNIELISWEFTEPIVNTFK